MFGVSEEALSAVARNGFTMAKMGSGGTTGSGGLYGEGTEHPELSDCGGEDMRR